MTMNTIMQGKQRKRFLSLTFESKEKLPPLVLPWPPRIKQTHLQWPYLPKPPPFEGHIELSCAATSPI